MTYLSVWLLLAVGPLLMVVPRALRRFLMVAAPVLALVLLFFLPNGEWGTIELLGQSLTLIRLDDLSRIFVLIFLIGAGLASIFAWHRQDLLEQSSAMTYAGGAIAAVCAGDLITLFIFWEIVSLASLLLILAARSEEAYAAAFRYFMVQILSGLALLGGLALSKGTDFGAIDPHTLAGGLILFACAVKAAFPLLHFWLPDAYPRATPTGTIFLSIFTTKLAIYALVRGFAGLEWLVYVGAVMAVAPALFAFAEQNLRRVLSYALMSQLGFMVAAVGIGTPLALNGAVAHAFASVLYQALLFMVVGASLLYGNLSRRYLFFCLIGSASIAGLPLLIGFATKSLTFSAALQGGYFYVWVALLAANAMAVVHTAVRVPYLLFFTQPRVLRDETPTHIFIAMALASILCLGLGLYPQVLYALLPFDTIVMPFNFAHITQQLQLILFASFLALVFMPRGSGSERGGDGSRDRGRGGDGRTLLDLDWFARGLPYLLHKEFNENIQQGRRGFLVAQRFLSKHTLRILRSLFKQNGFFVTSQPTGSMVVWIAFLLMAVMVLVLVIQ